MPGAYPRTSTFALTAATLPYVRLIADGGVPAVVADPAFAKGINTHAGFITYRAVADELGLSGQYREVGASAS
jgi:alanine dehydrogenase